jgi:hypothetical protein
LRGDRGLDSLHEHAHRLEEQTVVIAAEDGH